MDGFPVRDERCDSNVLVRGNDIGRMVHEFLGCGVRRVEEYVVVVNAVVLQVGRYPLPVGVPDKD